MANNVTLSALSDHLAEGFSGGADEVCAFWRERLVPVLADQTDLIVLPEAGQS